jgi:RNA-directed DNA polymerase
MIDKVYAMPNLQRAWDRVRENGGSAGVDGMSVGKFAEQAAKHLQCLQEDLCEKRYRPKPVRRVYLPKPGGGRRPLGIPTVRDRVVQTALLQVLEPLFERKFSKRSHGFRPERGCATALCEVDQAVRYGYGWVVDADIQSFFDTVDHEKLLDALNEEVADGRVLLMIRQILAAGVIEPLAVGMEPTEVGTPQGGPLSPLLANIYLHRFDQRMVEARHGLVRYADDFVIFARSESEAASALELARSVLEGELGLRLHPEKTRVVSVACGFDFLGFHYYRDPTTGALRKEVRAKSVRSFREAIRLRTPRLKTKRRVKARHVTPTRLDNNERVGVIIERLNAFLGGWHWYFKMLWSAYPQTPFRDLDGYVRARLRHAITGRVGSGWWNVRLNNAVLAGLGLRSLDSLHQGYLRGQLATPARKG